jgi:hypothetical protein
MFEWYWLLNLRGRERKHFWPVSGTISRWVYWKKNTRKSNNSRWLHRVSADPSRFTYSCGLTTWTRLLGVFHEQQLVLRNNTIACLSPIKQQVWSINGSHQNFNRFSLIWNNEELLSDVRLAKYCYGAEFKKNEMGELMASKGEKGGANMILVGAT